MISAVANKTAPHTARVICIERSPRCATAEAIMTTAATVSSTRTISSDIFIGCGRFSAVEKPIRWQPAFFFSMLLCLAGAVGLFFNVAWFALFYEPPPTVADLQVAAALKRLEKAR